jgi:hypothetical protein
VDDFNAQLAANCADLTGAEDWSLEKIEESLKSVYDEFMELHTLASELMRKATTFLPEPSDSVTSTDEDALRKTVTKGRDYLVAFQPPYIRMTSLRDNWLKLLGIHESKKPRQSEKQKKSLFSRRRRSTDQSVRLFMARSIDLEIYLSVLQFENKKNLETVYRYRDIGLLSPSGFGSL